MAKNLTMDEYLELMPDNEKYIKRYKLDSNKEYWKEWEQRLKRDMKDLDWDEEMQDFWDIVEYKREHRE
jgi:hypothetical protein